MKYLILTWLGIFALTVSCSDDKVLIPVWESGINGEGTITSTATDFKRGNGSIVLDFDLKWVSIDSKVTVTKMEVFVTFTEGYIDNDGNPAVADHGTKLIQTFEGAAVPANRIPVAFSMSQADMFSLYNGATFDYKDGVDGNAIDVFANPVNPGRDATNIFVAEDQFKLTWQFTGDDGRVFDAWSPSVCTEFPGSNCEVAFGVICAEEIENPAGDWRIDMVDTFGDGWQGGYVGIIIDGVEADQAFLVDGNVAPNPSVGAGSKTVTVPGSATSLSFVWNDDTFNSECQFKIVSPKGNTVANVTSVSAGTIKLNLCSE